MKKPLKKGDYVLATKYSDGGPMDPHCVGFFDGMAFDRYMVVDGDGKQFRLNGFRRCERITPRTGAVLCRLFAIISDRPGRSIWYWRRNIKKAQAIIDLTTAP